MEIKNNTEIFLLKHLMRNGRKKPRRTSRAYPKVAETKYRAFLNSVFRQVRERISLAVEAHFDSADTDVARELERYVDANFREGGMVHNRLKELAEAAHEHDAVQWKRQIENSLGVNFNTQAAWWGEAKESWAKRNLSLIKSASETEINRINTLAAKAVSNGWSVKQLTSEIKHSAPALTDKKARLIARDQMGSLEAQIAQSQAKELGLDLYVWSTSDDERVRGNPNGKYPNAVPSHFVMEGLTCKWSDPTVCSFDGGKTWQKRTSIMPIAAPGEPIQCRCLSLSKFTELFPDEDIGQTVKPRESQSKNGGGKTAPSKTTKVEPPKVKAEENKVETVEVAPGYSVPKVQVENAEKGIKNLIVDESVGGANTVKARKQIEDADDLLKLAMEKALRTQHAKITHTVTGGSYQFQEYTPQGQKFGGINIGKTLRKNTMRHELGHGIDSSMGKMVKNEGDIIPHFEYRSHYDEKFKTEFDNGVKEFLKSLGKNKKERNKKLFDDYVMGRYCHDGHDIEWLLDMMDAKGLTTPVGHGSRYWRGDKNARYTEAFAEFCEIMAHDGANHGEDLIEKYFSKAFARVKEILLEYIKE